MSSYKMNSNIFWANNLQILFQQNELPNFFPNSNYSIIENLNSIVRLCIYLSIVLVIYTRNPQYMFLPLGAMLITYILYEYYPDKKELFRLDNGCVKLDSGDSEDIEYTKPTIDNPFMNYNHITDNYHKPPACKAFLSDDSKSVKIREDVTNKFNEKLYRDVGDLYSRRNSQREFYTRAYDSIPDQTSFAKWLYTPPGGGTCKENGVNCAGWTGSLI